MRIALAEDNLINRNTFRQKLRELGRHELIFSANNGNECLSELQKMGPGQLPEVIFVDLEMPEMGGIEMLTIAHSLYPTVHFIVLTVFDDDEKVFEAIRAGASGYLLKHESAAVLQDAITHVTEFGGAPMSPAIARKALHLLSQAHLPATKSEAGELPAGLTDREKEVLEQMVKGWDAKKSALALDLSVLTVRKHIDNIYKKLHLNSKAQLISMAYQNKWFGSGEK